MCSNRTTAQWGATPFNAQLSPDTLHRSPGRQVGESSRPFIGGRFLARHGRVSPHKQAWPNAVILRVSVKSKANDNGIILLAEDRDEDAELLKLAFRKAGITNPIVVVRDGDEVLSYLLGMTPYENCPLPILLVLDLKMPNRNGFEALQWIREHVTLKPLRVIVMTVSESIYDVNRAYHIGANSFLIKTSDVLELVEQAKQIKAHWIDTPAPDIVRLHVLKKTG